MKVTIVTPCHNHGQYFQEAIDSIKHQTFKDIEHIAVMDMPIDDSLEIAEKNGLTIINPKERLGISKAMNIGLKAAQGEYVCCLSQDDIFKSTLIEKSVKMMEEGKDIVCTGLREFGSSNGTAYPCTDWKIESLSQNNQIYGSSMVRKSCYEKEGYYDENCGHYSDWEMWCRLCKAGYKLGIIYEPLYLFRRHPNQISNTFNEELAGYIRNKHAG